MTYDIDYFINKFDRIPEELWCEYTYTDFSGRHCALGHCGRTNDNSTSQAMCLNLLLKGFTISVNDGTEGYSKYGSTPKQRILTRLTELKFEELGL